MNIRHLLSISILTTFLGCSGGGHPIDSKEATADTAAVLSSLAAVSQPQDSTRQFIRTAELKFKVQDVRKATTAIEDITAKHQGFVTYTNLTSHIGYQNEVTVSADSTLQTIHYTVENELTLRVPNTALDSTLREIASLVQYLDYRLIKADEVGLGQLSLRLAQNRLKKHEERLARTIDHQGKKLAESIQAEENLLAKQERQDEARTNHLQLLDQVHFSTVKIQLYQRPLIAREWMENDRPTEAYQPSFFAKLRVAAQEGWYILEALLLFFTRLWGLVIVLAAGLFAYRKVASRIHSKA